MQIIGGQWTVPSEEDVEGAVSRKVTKGKHEGEIVWEIKKRAMDGYLISGALIENEHIGLQAQIVLEDKDGTHCLEFPATSQYAKAFISSLPYIDNTKQIHVQLVGDGIKKTKSGAQKFKLQVAQDKRLLKNHYTEWVNKTKEYVVANGMPESVKGISGWNFIDQNEFLLEKFQEFFNDYSPASIPNNEAEDDDDDCVPFPADVPADVPAPEEDEDQTIPF